MRKNSCRISIGKLEPLVPSIQKASDNLERTLKSADAGLHWLKRRLTSGGSISEDSPLAYQLNKTLEEVSNLARSVRHLADYPDTHPESVLRGEGGRKKMSRFVALQWIIISTLLAAIYGCASSPSSRFYLLRFSVRFILPRKGKSFSDRVAYRSVCPVEFPDDLDQAQIVTRVTPTGLNLPNSRIGRTPRDSVTRVLAENLPPSSLYHEISFFPWRREISKDYRIEVKVIRFDGTPETRLFSSRVETRNGGWETSAPVKEVNIDGTGGRPKLEIPGSGQSRILA